MVSLLLLVAAPVLGLEPGVWPAGDIAGRGDRPALAGEPASTANDLVTAKAGSLLLASAAPSQRDV